MILWRELCPVQYQRKSSENHSSITRKYIQFKAQKKFHTYYAEQVRRLIEGCFGGIQKLELFNKLNSHIYGIISILKKWYNEKCIITFASFYSINCENNYIFQCTDFLNKIYMKKKHIVGYLKIKVKLIHFVFFFYQDEDFNITHFFILARDPRIPRNDMAYKVGKKHLFYKQNLDAIFKYDFLNIFFTFFQIHQKLLIFRFSIKIYFSHFFTKLRCSF